MIDSDYSFQGDYCTSERLAELLVSEEELVSEEAEETSEE
jgi:hypothetical protein